MPPTTQKKIESYRDPLVWQKSMDLVAAAYALAGKLPQSERYGLTSQVRRAATFIPANIAEGFGRWHKKEFVRFLLMANGSAEELETHLLIAVRLRFLGTEDVKDPLQSTTELSKMIFALRDRLSKWPSRFSLPHCSLFTVHF